MQYMNDVDCWDICKPKHLWIFDKLIVAKLLGYNAGPAGVPITKPGEYVIRPIMNLHMMGRGAFIGDEKSDVPDGFFWQERFTGRHISIDFYRGKQVLCVEGFRKDFNQLDRFCMWKKIYDFPFEIPRLFKPILNTYDWVNFELVGGKIIEVHLRYNDDFLHHTSEVIYPVWKEKVRALKPDEEFFPNDCGDRLGFIIKKGSLV